MKLRDVLGTLNRKGLIILGVSTFTLIILIVGVLVLRDYLEDRSVNAREEQKMAYDTARLSQTTRMKNRSDLLFPEVIEELDLTMDLYRSKTFQWTEDEVSRLWIEPDASDIDYFTEANHQLIREILKDAP
ncbi:MAG: hypothetical protein PQJ58_01185 [Spirochaetales bacterium]|nr:hypothetical protein [Spirochaetales bacterium]